jgi:F-type H+-transporting ATPase subunit b
MRRRLFSIALLVFTALPLTAGAQEHEAVTLSPFAGNLGNAIWTLGIFVIVVIVLGKFAWGPVLGLLQQREQFIHTALADAKRDRDAAEARLKEYSAKLQRAHAEAATILEETRRDAERLREEVRQRAKTEADKLIANAERQIQLQTGRALEQIRREAVDLSVMIASKIIQRNLTREDNERLIDDALKQVENRRN